MRSDFSAIHGIRDPMEELSAARFFELAERLVAYRGMMRAHAEKAAHERSGIAKRLDEHGATIDRLRSGGTVGSPQGPAATPDGTLSRGVLASDARLREVVDFD